MTIVQAAVSSLVEAHTPWRADWLWGCPLIVLTVVLHVLGLGLLSQRAILMCDDVFKRRPMVTFATVIGATTLLATILHAIEVGIWALAYCAIGALPNFKSAMLFSLGAMTTYGHENLYLEEYWRLMGGMEALNGWLLFGLSTAFLFWLIQEALPKSRPAHDVR